MGCCFSKKDESDRNPPSPPLPPVPDSDISCLKPRCPPQLEEETVKEVLSETPTLKLPSFPKKSEEQQKSNHYPILPLFPKIEEVEEDEEEEEIEKEAPFSNVVTQEVSEVSEIYSLSESYSTTTLTEKKEVEEGEVRQRIDRSPAKIPGRRSNPCEFGYHGTPDRGRKSPSRRSEQPSPGRRNDNAGRFGSNTEVGQIGRRWSTASNNRTWRDPGESSGRRSRSPSTHTEMGQNNSGLGRSPSTRKTGRSPARIPSVAQESSSKSEDTKEENGLTNESLDNPLVSLECFIFL